MVAGNKSRKNPRAQVALVARYRSPTAFEFVEEECVDLSSGGMFIRSKAPAPSGTLLKLECELDGGKATMRAVARVVWLRERETSDEPRGMGVKFVKLEPGGRELIAQVLERLGGNEGRGAAARSSHPPPLEPLRAPSAISLAPALLQQQAKMESSAALQTALIEVKPPEAPPSDPAPAPVTARTVEAPKPAPAKSAAPAKPAPGKNDPRRSSAAPRSDVPTHRPPGKSGVDMRAIGIGVLLMGLVAVIAVVSQSSKRRATATVSQEPAAQPPAEAPAHQQFELRLSTLPGGANVTVGDRTGTSPMTIELGTLSDAIEVRVEKDGFEPVTSNVELARFAELDGKRVAIVMLALPPLREPAPEQTNVSAAVQAAVPAAAPEPAPAPEREPSTLEPVASKTRHARSIASRRPPKPEATEAAPAAPTAPEPTAAPTPEPELEPEPVAAPAPLPAPIAAAPAPAAPKPAPIAPMTPGSLTPMQAARACLARGDDACAIASLEGRARTAQELELLIETYRRKGNHDAAKRYMKQYIERYPSERRAGAYSAQLGLPAPQ